MNVRVPMFLNVHDVLLSLDGARVVKLSFNVTINQASHRFTISDTDACERALRALEATSSRSVERSLASVEQTESGFKLLDPPLLSVEQAKAALTSFRDGLLRDGQFERAVRLNESILSVRPSSSKKR